MSTPEGILTSSVISRRDFCKYCFKLTSAMLALLQSFPKLLPDLICHAQEWKFAAFVPDQSEQFFPYLQSVADQLINQPTMHISGGAAAIHDRERGTNFQAQAKAWADKYVELYVNPETTILRDQEGNKRPLKPIYVKSSGYCSTLNGAFARGEKDPCHAIGRGALIIQYSGYKLYKPADGLTERIEMLANEMIAGGTPFVIERKGDEIGFQTGAAYGVNWENRILIATDNGRGSVFVPIDGSGIYDAYRLVAPEEESGCPEGTLYPVINDPILETLYVFRGYDPEIISQMINGELQ